MNMNQTLLVELFTEELPPKALAKLGDAFSSAMVAGLKARDFLNDDFSAKLCIAAPSGRQHQRCTRCIAG
jgi:glycyl-tRNA synthetase beta subunit